MTDAALAQDSWLDPCALAAGWWLRRDLVRLVSGGPQRGTDLAVRERRERLPAPATAHRPSSCRRVAPCRASECRRVLRRGLRPAPVLLSLFFARGRLRSVRERIHRRAGPAAPPTDDSSVMPTVLNKPPGRQACRLQASSRLPLKPRIMFSPWSPSPMAVSSSVSMPAFSEIRSAVALIHDRALSRSRYSMAAKSSQPQRSPACRPEHPTVCKAGRSSSAG